MTPRHVAPALSAIAALALGCGGDETAASTPASTPTPTGRAALQDVVAVASGPAELVALVAVGAERCVQVAALHADRSTTAEWRPDDAALDRLVSARQVVLVGLDFEPWAQRAGLPPSRVLELGSLLASDRLLSVATVEHTHGSGPAHSHGGRVASAWSDPALLQAMVHGAAEALTGVLASEGTAEEAVERRREFASRVAAYGDALAEAQDALAGRTLIATDSGLEYVARSLQAQVEVTRLETQDGRPSDHGLHELETLARAGGHAGVLVWLQPIDTVLAARIESELGLRSVRFDLGAEPDASGDTLDRLTASARALGDALRG